MDNTILFPPPVPRHRNKSYVDVVVKVDGLASNSAGFKQQKVLSSSTPISLRNATSPVKVQPPLRPDLPVISSKLRAKKTSSGSKLTPGIGPSTQRTRSLSSSSSLNNIGEPSTNWKLKKDIKTTSSPTATCRKYVYSPFATTTSSTKLAPSRATSKSLGNSPIMKKPPRPDFPSGVQPTCLNEQPKSSPKYTRVKPARPALPPARPSCQLYMEVTSQTLPRCRPPPKVPTVPTPGARNSIEYTYIDPQKVLYPNLPHNEGQEEEKPETVNRRIMSVPGKVVPRRKNRNGAYSLDSSQCTSQYTSLQPLTFSRHEYALPIKSIVRRTSDEEESPITEKAGGQTEQPMSNDTDNETDTDVDYMNMSWKFESKSFTIDAPIPDPRSKTLPALSRNNSTSMEANSDDQDHYIVMSPKSLEKRDSGYIDVSGTLERSCSLVGATASLQTCTLPLDSGKYWVLRRQNKIDDCKMYLAMSPNTMDQPSIYTVPS